jgi:hypothetical protein
MRIIQLPYNIPIRRILHGGSVFGTFLVHEFPHNFSYRVWDLLLNVCRLSSVLGGTFKSSGLNLQQMAEAVHITYAALLMSTKSGLSSIF